MKRILASFLIVIASIFILSGCKTPSAVQDANQVSIMYLHLIQEDVNITIDALSEAAKEESTRYYDLWLEGTEKLIISNSMTPQEAIDDYKTALESAATQVDAASDTYDDLSREIKSEIQNKIVRAQKLAEKIAEYHQSGSISAEDFDEILNESAEFAIEMAEVRKNREKAVESANDGKGSDLLNIIKNNVLKGMVPKEK